MHRRLPKEAFQKAAAFLKTRARPLERELFQFWFENGSRERVESELARFQNEDGGFHGLEIDLRLPHSSAMATSIAFQYWAWLGTPLEHPARQRALAYLRETFDEKTGGWAAIPPEANDYPHAPWWHLEAGRREAGSPSNPTAEILGYFLEASPRPEPWLSRALDRQLSHLKRLPDAMEMHDLLCYLRLQERLPKAIAEEVGAKLVRAGSTIVTRDPQAWSGYSVKPLWLAPTPKALLAGPLAEEAAVNLDWEIARQTEDGSWAPNWSWGSPDEWRPIEVEWKGVLTTRTLRWLADYDRIA